MDIVNWWQGTAGSAEGEAFDALVQYFIEHGHANIRVNADSDNKQPDDASTRRYVKKRIVARDPPHTFQTLAGPRLDKWLGAIEKLDDDIDEKSWSRLFEVGQTKAAGGNGRDGEVSHYCVPIDLQRENILFYNKRIFEQWGIPRPEGWTWEDFHQAADKLRGHVAPLALGATPRSGWGVRLLFQAVMFSVMLGYDEHSYEDYFTGNELPNDDMLAAVLDEFLHVLDDVDPAANKLDWNGAVRALKQGQAAMLIQGDWAAPELWARPDEFGEAASPGTEGWFLFSSDCLPLPKGLAREKRELAISFLKTVLDGEAQYVFNSRKGSLPAVLDGQTADNPFARDRMVAANKARDEHHMVRSFAGIMTDTMEKNLFEPMLLDAYNEYCGSDRGSEAKSAVRDGVIARMKSIYPGFKMAP